jgi:hypothetical protein
MAVFSLYCAKQAYDLQELAREELWYRGDPMELYGDLGPDAPRSKHLAQLTRPELRDETGDSS